MLDKLLGLPFVYEAQKKFSALERLSIVVMNQLCHNMPCLNPRTLRTVMVEMVSRALFLIGISQGQNYTPRYLKQSCP